MVKRRVSTGLDSDAIGQLDLDLEQHPEEGIGQASLAKASPVSSKAANPEVNLMQHYFDIGKLMASGGDVSTVSDGPLDDEIEKEMGFGKEGPLGKEIADSTGTGGKDELSTNLAESIGYGEGEGQSGGGKELVDGVVSKLASDAGGGRGKELSDRVAQGLAGIAGGVGSDDVDSDEGLYEDGQEGALEGEQEGFSLGGLVSDQMEKTKDAPDEEFSLGGLVSDQMEKTKDAPSSVLEDEVLQPDVLDVTPDSTGVNQVEEALQNPDIRKVIELDNGIVLDQATEQQVDDWEAIVNDRAVEDESMSQRMEGLKEKLANKSLSNTELALLGVALLIPTLLAAQDGGVEGMVTAAGKAIEGGVGVFERREKKLEGYGEQLAETQKQKSEMGVNRGKVDKEFFDNIPQYAVKKALLGNPTYVDNNGTEGVSLGGKYIYYDKDVINSEEDIKALRDEQPKALDKIETMQNTNRVVGDMLKTVEKIREISGDDQSLMKKLIEKTSTYKYGPKAVLNNKEVNLIQQWRSLQTQFSTVTEISGETRFSKPLVDVINRLMLDPSKNILQTSWSDLTAELESIDNNSINNLGTYLASHSILLEPILQMPEPLVSRGEYDYTDEQYLGSFKNTSVEQAKESESK